MDTKLSSRLLGEAQSEADKCYLWQFKGFFLLIEFFKKWECVKKLARQGDI